MTINITVLSVTVSTLPTKNGSYQMADVAYKNNTFQGKVEGKKLMSFGAAKETFSVLSTAQSGASFDIEVVKNDKGYNDWVSAKPSQASSGSINSSAPQYAPNKQAGASASPKSTYETPEERAQKQVYIIRQSSISAAVSSLVPGAKSALKVDDVLTLAKQYEDFVFGKKSPGGSGFDDVPDFDADFDTEVKVD